MGTRQFRITDVARVLFPLDAAGLKFTLRPLGRVLSQRGSTYCVLVDTELSSWRLDLCGPWGPHVPRDQRELLWHRFCRWSTMRQTFVGTHALHITPILLKKMWTWLELRDLWTRSYSCCSALACFLARTEACIAAGRTQLSTHCLTWGPDPAPGPRGAKEQGVRWLCLQETTCQDTWATEIQVAAGVLISAGLWLRPSPTCHLCPQRSGVQQPPHQPWCQGGWWVCAREVGLLSETEFIKDCSSRITQVEIWRNQVVSPLANAEPWLPMLGSRLNSLLTLVAESTSLCLKILPTHCSGDLAFHIHAASAFTQAAHWN